MNTSAIDAGRGAQTHPFAHSLAGKQPALAFVRRGGRTRALLAIVAFAAVASVAWAVASVTLSFVTLD